jgi:hypothetical protein
LSGILQFRIFTGAGGAMTAGRGLPTGSLICNSPVFRISGIVGRPKKARGPFLFLWGLKQGTTACGGVNS